MSYCDGCKFLSRPVMGWKDYYVRGTSNRITSTAIRGDYICTHPRYTKVIPPVKLAVGSTEERREYPYVANFNKEGKCGLYEEPPLSWFQRLFREENNRVIGEALPIDSCSRWAIYPWPEPPPDRYIAGL